MPQNENILKRFFDKIEFGTEHDIWKGSVSSSGHGMFYIIGDYTSIGAHVFAYEFYYGVQAINDIHHTCEIKLCMRKEHLIDVTRSQHMLAHHNTGLCKRGHNLAIVGRKKSGGCKECQREDNKKYNERYGKSLR
jgi:hypothetical protein